MKYASSPVRRQPRKMRNAISNASFKFKCSFLHTLPCGLQSRFLSCTSVHTWTCIVSSTRILYKRRRSNNAKQQAMERRVNFCCCTANVTKFHHRMRCEPARIPIYAISPSLLMHSESWKFIGQWIIQINELSISTTLAVLVCGARQTPLNNIHAFVWNEMPCEILAAARYTMSSHK